MESEERRTHNEDGGKALSYGAKALSSDDTPYDKDGKKVDGSGKDGNYDKDGKKIDENILAKESDEKFHAPIWADMEDSENEDGGRALYDSCKVRRGHHQPPKGAVPAHHGEQ